MPTPAWLSAPPPVPGVLQQSHAQAAHPATTASSRGSQAPGSLAFGWHGRTDGAVKAEQAGGGQGVESGCRRPSPYCSS